MRFLVLTGSLLLAFGACSPRGDQPQASGAAQEDHVPALQAEGVPEVLLPLVPLAQRWGIGDDVLRNEAVDRASATEKQALFEAFRPHMARITAWLDSFGDRPMTEEAAAFMYTQLALDEMGFTWR